MILNATLILAPGVGCSRLGDELVLLDQTGQMLRGVNAQGAYVLALLDGARTVAQVAGLVGDEAQVASFLQGLLSRGLVTQAFGEVKPAAPVVPAALLTAPAIVWEQRFVGLQALSDPCRQMPPPGYCQGQAFRFDDTSGN